MPKKGSGRHQRDGWKLGEEVTQRLRECHGGLSINLGTGGSCNIEVGIGENEQRSSEKVGGAVAKGEGDTKKDSLVAWREIGYPRVSGHALTG